MPACIHGMSPLGACAICTPPNVHASTSRTFANPAEIAGQLQVGELLMDADGNLLYVYRCAQSRHVGHQLVDLSGQYELQLFGTEVEYTTGWDDWAEVRWPLRRASVVLGDGEEAMS